MEFEEVVVGEVGQRIQFLFEVGGEVDAEAFGHIGVREREVAHEAHDCVASDAVIFGDEVATGDGDLVLFDGVVVVLEFLGILPVGLFCLGDGGHTEGVDIGAAAGTITLEVTLEGFFALGHCEFIIGEGEVVHTDVDVAFGGEAFDGEFKDFEFHLRRGEEFLLDDFLGGFHPGDVGVIEDGEAVGSEGEDFFESGFEGLWGLVGETVDEVDID
ncbi:MAG: hypothetical protein RI897_1888 [Verrucomicrobiota bacterium]